MKSEGARPLVPGLLRPRRRTTFTLAPPGRAVLGAGMKAEEVKRGAEKNGGMENQGVSDNRG